MRHSSPGHTAGHITLLVKVATCQSHNSLVVWSVGRERTQTVKSGGVAIKGYRSWQFKASGKSCPSVTAGPRCLSSPFLGSLQSCLPHPHGEVLPGLPRVMGILAGYGVCFNI